MKKIFSVFFILILIAAGVLAWLIFGPSTPFSENSKFIYIRSDAATRDSVLNTIRKEKIITSPTLFQWLATQMKYWKNIKSGKYQVKKGASIFSIVRMLRNGQQIPVNLVITKIRTPENLARLVGNRFECDSVQMINFLSTQDSLKEFELNPQTVMTAVLPDTYTYFWNSTPRKIFLKLFEESQKFWTPERKQRALDRGLTPQQAFILASIIEEETNAKSDKPNIASVYLNRIQKKMPLQADPTIKFALRDFSLKRIYEKHLLIESPYNTYRNPGLPPGPICTPSQETIDSVLNCPRTDYLYFVANSDLSGTHIFTTEYEDHLKFAKEYQKVLNKLDSANQATQSTQ